MKFLHVFRILVLVGLVTFCSIANSSQLRVDVDIANSVQTEMGFVSATVDPTQGLSEGDGGGTFPSSLGIGGNLSVGINGGNTRVRAIVDPTVPLRDMFRDFSFSSNGDPGAGAVRVTIDVLLAGTYSVTTYHTDIDQDGTLANIGFPQPGGPGNQFDIEVRDATGSREAVTDAVWSTSGETFLVEADGVNFVDIFIRGDNPSGSAWFNGLDIQRVPEPSACILAALGCFTGLAYGRRVPEEERCPCSLRLIAGDYVRS